jgi:RHS repeat-associated protein
MPNSQTPEKKATSFSTKEKDEETLYSYFGARYYMSDISVWLSVDPMADKYPTMSPFMYCAGNPLKYIDPNGMEWDPSELTTEQQESWRKSMDYACKTSPAFKKMFEHLENSETVYKVNIGETQDNAPAQFNSNTNTLTYRDAESFLTSNAYIEEIFHAYQTDNNSLYDRNKEFNYEFEAKIAKLLIQYQGFGFAITPGTEKMVEFMEKEYGLFNVPSCEEINSNNFQSNYMLNAESYRQYNESNNIGNSHYRKKTDQFPQSIILLFCK